MDLSFLYCPFWVRGERTWAIVILNEKPCHVSVCHGFFGPKTVSQGTRAFDSTSGLRVQICAILLQLEIAGISRAAKWGGFKRGGVSRSGLLLPFLSFFGPFWDFPDLSGNFPICSEMVRGFSRFVPCLVLGLKSTYEEQSRKGPQHNPGLSRKKWENPRFGDPPVWLLSSQTSHRKNGFRQGKRSWKSQIANHILSRQARHRFISKSSIAGSAAAIASAIAESCHSVLNSWYSDPFEPSEQNTRLWNVPFDFFEHLQNARKSQKKTTRKIAKRKQQNTIQEKTIEPLTLQFVMGKISESEIQAKFWRESLRIFVLHFQQSGRNNSH